MFRSTTPIPATCDDCPAVQSALARLYELHGDEKRIDADLEAINAGIFTARSNSAINQAAHDLYDGVSSPAVSGDLHEQRERVVSKLRVVRRAIELASAKVNEARSASAMRIAESRGPEYRGIVAEVKKAILALQAAMSQERVFRNHSHAMGASTSARCMRPMDLNIEYRLETWLAEAKEYFGL